MTYEHTVPYRLAVVIGSVREGRVGPTVARWFADRAADRPGVEVETVDLAATGPDGTGLAAPIEAADAVVVVTPEYNHSFPGPLKTAIDASGGAWRAKPVGLVSYGGLSGGLRAVEALRPVLAELHAVTVRDTVSFHGVGDRFDDDGQATDPGAAAAADVVLDSLAWWAATLHPDRRATAI